MFNTKKKGDLADYKRNEAMNWHINRGHLHWSCTTTEYRRYLRSISHRRVL